mgnify:CR=1 FL=1|jgi:glycosyltransferase involved in cell wall biosynthesis
MNNNKITLLLIGHHSPKVSGSALSFGRLYKKIKLDNRINYYFINTSRRYKDVHSIFVNINVGINAIYQFLKIIKHVDICSFHASEKAFAKFAPLLVILSIVYNKPIILRLFGGGSGITNRNKFNIFTKYWFFQIKKSDTIFLQTKYLLEHFEKLGFKNLTWLPTSRKRTNNKTNNFLSNECNKFVFMGRVIEEKGIITILDSIEWLNDSVVIDIWGSLDGSISADYIDSQGRGIIKYKGEIPHDKVQKKLAEYDALILPTYYKGEGYPGIIIESYCQGLPVVTTEWLSIPEIVDDTSGFLIPVGSPKELADTMNKMVNDKDLYKSLRNGAYKKGKFFSETKWYNQFISTCFEIVQN